VLAVNKQKVYLFIYLYFVGDNTFIFAEAVQYFFPNYRPEVYLFCCMKLLLVDNVYIIFLSLTK